MLNVSSVWRSSCLNVSPHVSYYSRHVNHIRATQMYSIGSIYCIWGCLFVLSSHDSLTPQAKSVIETPSIWKDMVNFKCNKPCLGCTAWCDNICSFLTRYAFVYLCEHAMFTVKVTGRHIETFIFYYIYFQLLQRVLQPPELFREIAPEWKD